MRYPIAEKGDFVVKVIVGGGFKTATVQRVESIKDKVIRLVDSSLEYDVYSGREIDPAITGFHGELIAFDGGEVEQWGFDKK